MRFALNDAGGTSIAASNRTWSTQTRRDRRSRGASPAPPSPTAASARCTCDIRRSLRSYPHSSKCDPSCPPTAVQVHIIRTHTCGLLAKENILRSLRSSRTRSPHTIIDNLDMATLTRRGSTAYPVFLAMSMLAFDTRRSSATSI